MSGVRTYTKGLTGATNRSATLLLALALLTSLFLHPVGASEQMPSVVVRGLHGANDAIEAVLAVGGQVKQRLDLIDGVLADVPEGRSSDELSNNPRVAGVTQDYGLEVQGNSYSSGLESSYPASVGATSLLKSGITGRGVTVALLDTGISEHPDLAGRIVASADLTNEGSFTDSYGHGTFLAGLVAGDGASSKGRFKGVAPEAGLMSIKVAGADGATTLGQVLYGLQLIDASKETFSVKVVLLALAGPAHDGPDPLEIALERLWADGLTVVVSAGNSGPAAGTVATPGVDPFVMTVGGINDKGTEDRSDDEVADWSARGPAPDGRMKPEVVAPGQSLVSLRATGSSIDSAHPEARVEDAYFKGSGTSMAAAVAAGAAALLAQDEPGLTPNQVKGRFMNTAYSVKGAGPDSSGTGGIDVARAAAKATPAANTDLSLLSPQPVSYPPSPEEFIWYWGPDGSVRWLGKAWAGKAWAGKAWAGKAWAGKAWADQDWSGKAWADSDWAGKAWASSVWSGKAWAGKAWANEDWAGKAWANSDWAGKAWAGKAWAADGWG